jgi:formate-dependent nitrite reductase membrane component NrfD
VGFAICVALYTGALLGVCNTFPLWNNALLPILFLVSAMSAGAASVLLIAVFRHADEFNMVGVLKKFHFCFPVIEILLLASLVYITAFNSTAGFDSVMSLLVGVHAPLFWIGLVVVGLLIPTALETWLLFFSAKKFEQSKKAHYLSAASDAGVLVGGFLLRYLVIVAAMPITLVAF